MKISPAPDFSRFPPFLFASGLAWSMFVGACSSNTNGGPVCPAEEDVISDFNMDNGVRPTDGRQGGWYTYADKSGFGTLTPPEGGGATPDLAGGNPACSKGGALRVKAVNFTDWGAATGTDFMPKATSDGGIPNAKGTYNASKYRGISFWAKAAAEVKFAIVKFLDPYTEVPSVLPPEQNCLYRAGAINNCSPYIVKFGHGYTGEDATAIAADYPKYAAYKIDTAWKRFEILFADTKQDRFNPGQKSPGDKLDVTQLVGMAIQINSDRTTDVPVANDFEIWLDDVGFIK